MANITAIAVAMSYEKHHNNNITTTIMVVNHNLKPCSK